MNSVKVGLIQASCGKDKEANISNAITQIEKLSSQGAQIICLQELFASLYFCQTEDSNQFSLSEPVKGPTVQRLQKIAKKNKIVLIVPFFEKRTEGIYHNSTVVIDADGSVVDLYRKMHIPDDPNFYEKYYFTPGDLGFRAVQTSYAKIGVLICWDQWFPEAARMTALQGAHILFYPTAIAWHPAEKEKIKKEQHDAWRTIQRSHAIANEVFVVSANRVGREADLDFWGQSFIAGPFGQILAEASSTKPENLIVDCDLNEIEKTRQAWPFLRDRRIDAFKGLKLRFID
jgi:N-carbamoylputrescine amidase